MLEDNEHNELTGVKSLLPGVFPGSSGRKVFVKVARDFLIKSFEFQVKKLDTVM